MEDRIYYNKVQCVHIWNFQEKKTTCNQRVYFEGTEEDTSRIQVIHEQITENDVCSLPFISNLNNGIYLQCTSYHAHYKLPHQIGGLVSNSRDCFKNDTAAGTSSNARAPTANLAAFCASATFSAVG